MVMQVCIALEQSQFDFIKINEKIFKLIFTPFLNLKKNQKKC